MSYIIDLISWIFLLAGSFCVIAGAVGVMRFPDFFTRLHAAGVTDTAGATLILFGLMVQAGLTLITVKLIMIWVFLMLTSPTASHALAKAAISDGIQPLLFNDKEKPSSKP